MVQKKAPAKKSAVAVAKPTPVKKSAPTAKPAPAKKRAAPTPVATKPAALAKSTVTPEQRWKLVAEAAYYLAEKRGFAGGHSVADWLSAERQVAAKLRS